jgi:hypothetical protein
VFWKQCIFVLDSSPDKIKIMKATTIILLLACLYSSHTSYSQLQDNVARPETARRTPVSQKKKLNFFIVSKRKKGALDPATRFNVFRAKLKSIFRQKKFVAIVARDAQQASTKIQYRLKKYDAHIGTLWFDSHGMYKKGYSLFFIGRDEVSYKTLKDSCTALPFEQLAPFADNQTNVIIGSCYGGATYTRSSIDYKDTTRMNGDSLMISLGKLLRKGHVYASESWVMTKPGLFMKRAAVAGFPGRKLFLDVCYQPAWERVGKWNAYHVATETFNSINPVTLDMYGNVIVRTLSYTHKEDIKKNIEKNIEKLQPGLYK